MWEIPKKQYSVIRRAIGKEMSTGWNDQEGAVEELASDLEWWAGP